jgi:hypothetical protein
MDLNFFFLLFFILISLFFAITFLESAWDKTKNKQGNLDWLQAHFSKTFLASRMNLVFGILTLLEWVAGVLSLFVIVGMMYLFISNAFHLYAIFKPYYLLIYLYLLKLLILLYAGQRLAKDYVGASGIVGYILLASLSFGFLLIF